MMMHVTSPVPSLYIHHMIIKKGPVGCVTADFAESGGGQPGVDQ
jgi:hypothetical protein